MFIPGVMQSVTQIFKFCFFYSQVDLTMRCQGCCCFVFFFHTGRLLSEHGLKLLGKLNMARAL